MADPIRIENLLADRPDLEAPLATLLQVDDDADTWDFDDVPVDSGRFGELVARDVVEKVDTGYRLADPDAVRQALHGESTTDAADGTNIPSVSVGMSFEKDDAQVAVLLAGALVLVAAVRSVVYGSVFRGRHVVLSGNDPYYYRYWVEQTLTKSQSLADLPGGIENGEPLLVATLARIADVIGGIEVSGIVLALYPVVSAILTGLLLYWMMLRLTSDRRIALVTVVMLAVTPGHALRTALGFADHHAFDYVFLTMTAAALIALAGLTDREDVTAPGTWLAALMLGVGVGAQTLAWDSGPLMLVPAGVVVIARVILDVRAERSPLLVNAPMLAGFALGALIALYGHVSLGWHTEVVTAAPVLLLAGAVTVVVVGELASRLGREAKEVAIAETAAGMAGVWVVWTAFPEFRVELLRGLDRVFRSDNIAEVRGLFSESLDFLLLFGFFLVIALPVLVWASRRAIDDARWIVPCSYGWYFLVLSLLQVRFTGQFGIFTAPFVGIAFVWLAAKVDLTSRPRFEAGEHQEFAAWIPGRPDASTVVAIFVLLALVGGPGLLQSTIKVNQVSIDDGTYEAAAWMADYADQKGWETRGESYVFSEWGTNRVYNYFVNGDSLSYGYARSNYRKFGSLTDPEEAVDVIDGRVRFVVTRGGDSESEMMHARLHDNLGSRNGDVAGLGRFRAVYAEGPKVFVYVSGATIRGTAQPNATVDVSTPVDITGASFTYERRTRANETGVYEVRVAQPGEYEVATQNVTGTVTVSESVVTNGTTVTAL